MTEFLLRTRPDQGAAPRPTVLLDWFDTGGGSTVQARHSLAAGLAPPAVAIDFLRFAAAVYCADRLSERPGTWTRAISLDFPVRGIDTWLSALDDLSAALAFLSGDEWRLSLRATTEPGSSVAASNQSVDAVCLFSGGLDSFAGALDLLADGKTLCLVAHYEGGQAPKAQEHLARRLAQRFGQNRIVLRRLFLRPAPPAAGQTRPLPETRESSTRSRSLLFLAAGLVVAAGYGGEVPLFIPENGFIGINVPLTEARSGSLSTRTTHPHFIDLLCTCISRLGMTNTVVNPFRVMTKGEILANSNDREALAALARETVSCAHPEAPRYAQREQGNCGYCFPCLIRRAAMHHVGLDDPADYAFDALHEESELTGHRGDDLRALVRSLSSPSRSVDVLRNGPVPAQDVAAFAGVYERGRQEIRTWIEQANPSPNVRRQLLVQ